MEIAVLYGTESGNAELVAEDLGDALSQRGWQVAVHDMAQFPLGELSADVFYLLVCSTHGEGELPGSARPFFQALSQERPDLSGIRFAAFGLGDSSYAHYSRGLDLLVAQWLELGAKRSGPIGRHDASSRDLASDVALAWAARLCEEGVTV
ncbi:nitric oxide synthase [Bordetella sp. J329]|nr:nitric oxide synthase [Bordetella sp. J329]